MSLFSRSLLIALTLAVLPAQAWAMRSTEWDFRGSTIPGKWSANSITNAAPSENGLVISTQEDGFLTRTFDVPHPVEAVVLTLETERPMESVILWTHTDPTKGYVQLPFSVTSASGPQEIAIDVSTSSHWNSRAGEFGIAFPAGAMLVLQSIRFEDWNWFENVYYALKTALTFDTFNAHSINFLWGPQMNSNPVAFAQMHQMDPPFGCSANWAILGFLLLAGGGCFLFARHHPRFPAITVIGTLLAVSWVLYDARMGLEVLSYVGKDWRTYVLEEPGSRRLRTMDDYYDAIQESAPLLQEQPLYLYVGPPNISYLYALLRYTTYPSLPLRPADWSPDQPGRGFIYMQFNKDDVQLLEHQLLINGTVVSSSGTLLDVVTPNSYLVRMNP
ncbi:hypothetical protein COU80_06090 [Candidatus Peregrinibacteria bacterium CG10_big_fil_rev_8_21_14_0_10_55_24]|nr:MAG: hypothetical protein COU80_06090 [Candidatus Peregrinibacteria bacterium CG10_big_fil_rev_8_21_14_0_10_55_24]